MKNLQMIILVLAAAAGIASCTVKGKSTENKMPDVIPVKTMQPLNNAEGEGIKVSGQFTTDDEVMLSFKIGGVIERIYVKEGDAVHKGQLLATLNLTEINTQVQQAQLAFEKAQRDYQRVVSLHNDSVATLEQLQNAKTGVDVARQQLSAVQFNRSYSEIHAAKDGYILRKLANEGQVITSGTAVFQTNGAQSGNWMLRVGMSDKEWAAVKLNDEATIMVNAAPGKAYTGRISRKSEGADAASGAFTVDIKLNGEQPKSLAAGMFGRAVIKTENNTSETGIRAIPFDALLDGDGTTGYVFVTTDNKTAIKRKIQIAGMDQDNVLISGGLEDTDAVIVSGSAYLSDHSAIRVIQ
ncbi:efflux RND transporter periplasmic adaptor subunit [Chitinophagaceae bacterium MMS25-I14]